MLLLDVRYKIKMREGVAFTRCCSDEKFLVLHYKFSLLAFYL